MTQQLFFVFFQEKGKYVPSYLITVLFLTAKNCNNLNVYQKVYTHNGIYSAIKRTMETYRQISKT